MKIVMKAFEATWSDCRLPLLKPAKNRHTFTVDDDGYRLDGHPLGHDESVALDAAALLLGNLLMASLDFRRLLCHFTKRFDCKFSYSTVEPCVAYIRATYEWIEGS